MSEEIELDSSLNGVPLFPLPNVVLFPHAILPLHIFEERYKLMTAEALEGDRLIAMALLRPGWEKRYYERPEIDPVVCVGLVMAFEKMPDGNYNMLLQGLARARVEREISGKPYRRANLEIIEETAVMEIDLNNERQRLLEVFSEGVWADTAIGQQFRKLILSPLSTAAIADLVAFNFLENVQMKQSLLGERDVRHRVEQIVGTMETMTPIAPWPTGKSLKDPGMN